MSFLVSVYYSILPALPVMAPALILTSYHAISRMPLLEVIIRPLQKGIFKVNFWKNKIYHTHSSPKIYKSDFLLRQEAITSLLQLSCTSTPPPVLYKLQIKIQEKELENNNNNNNDNNSQDDDDDALFIYKFALLCQDLEKYLLNPNRPRSPDFELWLQYREDYCFNRPMSTSTSTSTAPAPPSTPSTSSLRASSLKDFVRPDYETEVSYFHMFFDDLKRYENILIPQHHIPSQVYPTIDRFINVLTGFVKNGIDLSLKELAYEQCSPSDQNKVNEMIKDGVCSPPFYTV